jgi:hypothetical protein
MSYIINKTDGTVLTTILDGTTNTDTGVTLIGRNYTTYGEIQNENFVRLLENFADTIPPGQSVGFSPLAGTLWWNTNTVAGSGLTGPRLYVYNGTNWIPASERTVGGTAPADYKTGDQWWDTTSQQLKVYAGSTWVVIGPTSSAAQGKSGVYIETIVGTDTNQYQVICTYSLGELLSIQSPDTFTVAPTSPYTTLGFSNIVQGINIPVDSLFNGTATNALKAGGINPANFARNDINNTFIKDVIVSGRVTLGSNANIYMSTNDLALQNRIFNGNVIFQVNGTAGQLIPLKINGDTGTLVAPAAPTDPYHITNKIYVDGIRAFLQSELDNVNNELRADVQQVFTDYIANLNTVVDSTNSKFVSVNNNINTNINQVNQTVENGFEAVSATTASLADRINSVEVFLPNVALSKSPTFIGTPSVPLPQAYFNYASSLGQTLNPYQINLSRGITVIVGDTITQYRTDNNSQIARYRVTLAVSNSVNITATIIDGAVSQSVPSYIALNGTPVTPTTTVNSIVYLGPNLTFAGIGDNTTKIAATAYVDGTANMLYLDYVQKIATAKDAAIAAVQASISAKSPLASPQFTGTPTAPTPSTTDNSTNIATTAFVKTALQSNKLAYTVSTQPPSGGVDGDFWFQIG